MFPPLHHLSPGYIQLPSLPEWRLESSSTFTAWKRLPRAPARCETIAAVHGRVDWTTCLVVDEFRLYTPLYGRQTTNLVTIPKNKPNMCIYIYIRILNINKYIYICPHTYIQDHTRWCPEQAGMERCPQLLSDQFFNRASRKAQRKQGKRTCMDLHIYIYMCMCVYVYVCVSMYIYIYVYMYAYIHMCILNIYVCMCMYLYVYIYEYI